MTSLSHLIIGEKPSQTNLRNSISTGPLIKNSSRVVNSNVLKDDLKEENLEFKEFKSNLIKEHRDNVLNSIGELIDEIESATELINEQACEHIHDGDNILTANQSNQIDEFLIVKFKFLS